jgi:2-phosphoglycerate kinase
MLTGDNEGTARGVAAATGVDAYRAELLPEEVSTAKPKRKRVVRGFQAQVHQMGTAIDAIIGRHLTEGTSLVIEGTHLVPGLSPRVGFEPALVAEIVLAVADEADHRENFGRREARAKGRPSDDYLEHFPEIRMIQEFVLQQAAREGVPVVDTADLDHAVERAVDVVLDALAAEQAEAPAGA